MTHDLTDADRRNIDAVYEREWGGGETKVAEYYLCEAAYRAGLAAGRARTIEEAAQVCVDFSNDELPTLDARYGAAECCGLIRALINPPA